MTSKLGQQTGIRLGKDADALEKFPHFPPRDDMQNSLHLDRPAHQAALEAHFGNLETTIVLSEIPVRPTPGGYPGVRIPDLLIAFNVDFAQGVEQNGYSIRDQGKPPDFVLEVASVRTAENDYTNKRLDYAAFSIPEYWRFDPTGGQRYDAPLAGDSLSNGAYQPIEIVEIEPGQLRGHSEVLNLDLCWEHGQLRWYDPVTERYLMTYAEERAARMEEREGRIAERQARIAEREARAAAETRADAAEARVRELEEELKKREQS